MSGPFSPECIEVLRSLKDRRNVLISGPPAAGKSRLLAEVAAAFETNLNLPAPSASPVLTPEARVPIPAKPPIPALDPALQDVLPAADRPDRKVFRTVFHQNSKHREFLTGVVPSLGMPGSFEVSEGILFRASEHALKSDGASLLIIDEINRGPAVQVFGGAIVAMEAEKRLAPNGGRRVETQYFELLDPRSGKMVEYAFPHHLYILGAMNQADVSVEPLDVAFLRRWAPFQLVPNGPIAREHFRLSAAPGALAVAPTTAAEVYEALVQAWTKVNERISLGRGPEFQIGHGVIMFTGAPSTDLTVALAHAASSWRSIRAHVDEVFFGDTRGLAASLGALGKVAGHPYSLQEVFFAEEPRQELTGPRVVGSAEVFNVLRSVAA